MPQPPSYPRPRRSILRYVLWALTALAALATFVVVTPYVFLAAGHIQPYSWTELGNEGQAYGGIAEIFGMLAIVGVVASLVMQARESAANRAQMHRSFQADLLYKALDDPELLECWGAPLDRWRNSRGDTRKPKQATYVNLIFSFWYAMFQIGSFTASDVHSSARDVFAGAPAREYWPNSRPYWLEVEYGGVSREFIEIVDDAYRHASAAGPATSWPESKAPASSGPSEQSMIGGLAVGTICGATITGAAMALLRLGRRM